MVELRANFGKSVAIVVALTLAGCDQNAPESQQNQDANQPEIEHLVVPSAAEAMGASLAHNDQQGTILTWVEKEEDGATLYWSEYNAGKFSPKHPIAQGNDWFVNWADFPALAMAPDLWVAHWLQKAGDATYAYHVMTTTSTDGGQSWSSARRLHRDAGAGEHGFVSYVVEGEDSVRAVWLDGQATGAAGHGSHGAGMMMLRSAVASADGIADEVMLDDSVCDCCQTDVAMADSGAVVVYRNRTTDEVRDIGVVRQIKDGWSQPQVVAQDNWQIAACPVNGPAVAAQSDTVVVAWFTMANQHPQIKAAISKDGGATFQAPIDVKSGGVLGRLDVTLDQQGRAYIAYLKEIPDSDQAAVTIATLNNGQITDEWHIGETSIGRQSGFVRSQIHADQLLVAWRSVTPQEAGLKVAAVSLN